MRPAETVRQREVRALFEQAGPVLWANLAVGTVLVGALWPGGPQATLAGWLALVLLMTVVRGLLQARYRKTRPSHDTLLAWGRRFVVGSSVAGLLWGAAGVIFYAPGSPVSQSVLILSIAGMGAAAAGTLACHLPAFFGFFVLALAPLTLRTLIEGDRLHLSLGATMVAFAFGMLRVARINNRAYRGAFSLDIENAKLLSRLQQSQDELRETNRTLEERVLDRTRALEEQGQALRRAQRLEIAGRLAGAMAHDFNSLLTVIINNSASLAESQPHDGNARQAAEESLEAAQRGAALIRQLLAFTRQQRAEPQVFSLNRLVEEWTGLFRHILGQGVVTHAELTATSSNVCFDPAQVEQLLVNLVADARAALPSGGRLLLSTRAVTSEAGEPNASGDYVELVVRAEDAAGVDASRRANLASYFDFDADAPSKPVGLAAARALVEQWGNEAVVDALPEGGVAFRIRLPASTEALTPPASERSQTQLVRHTATLLLVDDEPTLRSVMRRCLQREGYTVLAAEDAVRALALAADHPGGIDLLVTDVVMPGKSGLELSRQLRRDRPDLPVLFISGFTFEQSLPAADPATHTGYLPKPFDTKVLVAKVRELLPTAPPVRQHAPQ